MSPLSLLTLSRLLLSLLLLLLLSPSPILSSSPSSSPSSSSLTCGGLGVDLTPLSTHVPPTPPSLDQDLVWTNGNDWFGVHPCGAVEEVFCHGAMVCLYHTPLAFNEPSNITYSLINSSSSVVGEGGGGVEEEGVVMRVRNGAVCAATGEAWGVDLRFVCDRGVVEGRLVGMVQDDVCHYTGTVRTRYACGAEVEGEGEGGGRWSMGVMIGVAVGVTVVAVLVVVGCVGAAQRWRGGKTWPRENKLLEGEAGVEGSKVGGMVLQSTVQAVEMEGMREKV